MAIYDIWPYVPYGHICPMAIYALWPYIGGCTQWFGRLDFASVLRYHIYLAMPARVLFPRSFVRIRPNWTELSDLELRQLNYSQKCQPN